MHNYKYLFQACFLFLFFSCSPTIDLDQQECDQVQQDNFTQLKYNLDSLAQLSYQAPNNEFFQRSLACVKKESKAYLLFLHAQERVCFRNLEKLLHHQHPIPFSSIVLWFDRMIAVCHELEVVDPYYTNKISYRKKVRGYHQLKEVALQEHAVH